jgi:hypothetical protein
VTQTATAKRPSYWVAATLYTELPEHDTSSRTLLEPLGLAERANRVRDASQSLVCDAEVEMREGVVPVA